MNEHYLVVFHDNHWQVTHQGTVEGPFSRREDAVSAAVEAAHADGENGIAAEVRVQEDSDRDFQLAWKYGRDPYPPRAYG